VTVVAAPEPRAWTEQGPVLLGVDGPPASQAAIEVAFEEASRLKVHLVALHAWAEASLRLRSRLDRERQLARGQEALDERLAGWQHHYPEVKVVRRLVLGEPTRSLVEASKSARLTIVGSDGRGGFAGMMLGSVGLGVAQAAHTPVTVVRPR
jgi:nucleotide-binding universal stress UspA family protein